MIIIIDNGVTVAQLDREGLRSTRNYLLSIIRNTYEAHSFKLCAFLKGEK